MRLQKTRTDVCWSPDWGDGIKPDPERVEALLEHSRLNNVSELRTVLGMFQYLAKFVYDMSSVMKPMTDDVWSWDKAQQASFDKTKELLTTTPTLSYYNSTKPTVVSADAYIQLCIQHLIVYCSLQFGTWS